MLVAAAVAGSLGAQTAASHLEMGLRAFRAGDYQSAVVDLGTAARVAVTRESLQPFVSSGDLEALQTHHTALVYLALAHFRLGHEEDARATIDRLVAAERIVPIYENLPLQTDATEFEAVAAALVPASNLPKNVYLVAVDPNAPLPPVTPAPRVTTTPADSAQQRTARAAAADALLAFTAPAAPTQIVREVPVDAPPPPATTANEPVVREEPVDEARIAQLEAELAARIAAAQAEADRRIAAIEAEAQRRVAAAEARASAAERAAQAARTARESAVTAAPPPLSTAEEREYLISLRQAEAFATNGATDRAAAIYQRIAGDARVPREIVAEAGVGLYRIGAYREAADVFGRMGAFGRGEEDLRYYYAVALFESGNYERARRELDCALPFIQINDEVARYRLRIQQTAAMQGTNR